MPWSGLSPPHAPVTRAPLKRIAVVRIPEEERVLHVRVVPTWLPHPASASQVRAWDRTCSERAGQYPKKRPPFAKKPPPPIVCGKWSRASWMLKHKLDIPPYETLWNLYKPYTNAYERIHVSSNHQRTSENVASYVPLSRSYFKMWELLHDYPLATMADGMQSVHLAEGPGGFIETLCRYRNRRARRRDAKCVHDRYTGIIYCIPLLTTRISGAYFRCSDRTELCKTKPTDSVGLVPQDQFAIVAETASYHTRLSVSRMV